MSKKLLVVYHSQTGVTKQLVDAFLLGSTQEADVETRIKKANDADITDLLWCDGVAFATPENFGTMSGAIKDFFDRTYYPALPYELNLPYVLFIAAGNDGSGASMQVQRILKGYPMRLVSEPIIVVTKQEPGSSERVDLSQDARLAGLLGSVKDLGHAFAAGLVMGIY